MRFLWNSSLLLALSYTAVAQHATADLVLRNTAEIGVSQHVGDLIRIHGEYPENGLSDITEVHLTFQTRGRRSWHAKHRYPAVGLSAAYLRFGNDAVLGYAVGLLPHARFSFGNSPFGLRMGMGAAWFSSPYDVVENPGNLVIGTRIANFSQVWCGGIFPLGKRLRLATGVSLTHCSSFHLSVPNIGANIVALNAGFSWMQRDDQTGHFFQQVQAREADRHWRPGVQLVFGLHEFQGTIRPVGGPRYPVYGLSLYMRRETARLDAVAFGLTYHYYTAFHDYTVSQQLDNADGERYARNVVVFAQYDWMFGHFGVILQGGVNVYAPFYRAFANTWDLPSRGWLNVWTANKVAYRYHFHLRPSEQDRSLYAGIAIKANGGTADFLELQLGVNW